jgi:hypothetical protein
MAQSHGTGKVARCAVCTGKFGLIRHYSWRTALCSRKCVDRFRARSEKRPQLVGWLQIACSRPTEHRARAL